MSEPWLTIAQLGIMTAEFATVVLGFLLLVNFLAKKVRIKFKLRQIDETILERVEEYQRDFAIDTADSAEVRDGQFLRYLDGLGSGRRRNYGGSRG